jgi:hypothetical protein
MIFEIKQQTAPVNQITLDGSKARGGGLFDAQRLEVSDEKLNMEVVFDGRSFLRVAAGQDEHGAGRRG